MGTAVTLKGRVAVLYSVLSAGLDNLELDQG